MSEIVEERSSNAGKYASLIIVLIIIGVVVAVVGGSFYTIDQGQRGVLLTNGAYSSTEEPGLHFKLPFLQSIVKFSTQQHVISWSCVISQPGDTRTPAPCDADSKPEMLAYSKDQQPAALRVTVNYHVPEAEVANAYSNYGSVENLAERIIARKAPQEVKTVFGQYDAVSVIQHRATFNSDVYGAVAKVIDGPVIIDSVQVENIDFSDAYESAVEARMTAQVEVQKQQQNLDQEKIKAAIAVTQAQGRADSVKAEADADAYSIKVQGDAQAGAIKARAGALADNPLLIQLTQAEKWNGVMPTTMVPGSAVPFIGVK